MGAHSHFGSVGICYGQQREKVRIIKSSFSFLRVDSFFLPILRVLKCNLIGFDTYVFLGG